MRVGVSSRGRWWVSMGPLGWLLYLLLLVPVVAAVAVGWVVYQLLRFLWLTLRELGFLLGSLVRHAH